MSDAAASADFADKWRAHWPEWAIAEAFVPRSMRQVAVAWFALLQELAGAAWAGSDSAPGLAKLAWWQEELRGWAKGARRHPLGATLQSLAAPWAELALALPTLRDQRDAPSGSVDRSMMRLAPFTSAATQVEAALFDAPQSLPRTRSGVPVEAMAAALLAEPVALAGNAGAVPVLAGLLDSRVGARPRQLLQSVLRARLLSTAQGAPWQPAARWNTLWRCWHAARN